jgi:dipeptidyl aminopeptidase/acylaminoacyl peptidase
MSLTKYYSLDFAARLLIALLVVVIGVVIWLGNQLGVRVTPQFSAGDRVGPFGPLTLVFSEAVNERLVTEKIFIQPDVEGKFTMVDARTLQFVPAVPFEPDVTYKLALAPGSLTDKGALLKRPRSWDFQTRLPLVAYLVADANKSRLWTIEPESGKTSPLIEEVFRIADFDTSDDGEFVVFSAFNEQNGVDLWRVDHFGRNLVLLLACGPDRCTVPAISPDGHQVAYVREAAFASADLPFGSPRIWLLNISSKEDAPLYEDQQIIGYKPVWSPDGTYISSFDGVSNQIHLLNLATGEQLVIPSRKGSLVTWSGDSATFVYTDIEETDAGPLTLIRAVNLERNETSTLFGAKDERDYYYNSLAWSPVENALVIGLRFEENNMAEALWVINPVSRDGRAIADQKDYVHSSPQWDPWGKTLLFQQFFMRGDYKPEIALWKGGTETKIIAEGLMPHWLP